MYLRDNIIKVCIVPVLIIAMGLMFNFLATAVGVENTNTIMKETNDSTTARTLALWKDDKYGCTGVRDSVLTDVLRFLQTKDLDFKEIESYLGEFDTTRETDTFILGRYYYNSICYNGKITEESSYCALEFWYNKGAKNYKIQMPCN